MQVQFNFDRAPAQAICSYCGKIIQVGEKCVAIANFGRTVVKSELRFAPRSFKIELAPMTQLGFKGSEVPQKFNIEPEIKVYHRKNCRIHDQIPWQLPGDFEGGKRR
jgi:hypothetical protein